MGGSESRSAMVVQASGFRWLSLNNCLSASRCSHAASISLAPELSHEATLRKAPAGIAIVIMGNPQAKKRGTEHGFGNPQEV
jgi:hypothetical protein